MSIEVGLQYDTCGYVEAQQTQNSRICSQSILLGISR